ncbi:type 4 pilus major pilin [Limnohabitans sp. JirII-31]|uniref:type 4 pilus major pilin n=1 Tax=Limnohabitans sp. JirII-31 TaxID=1977908 RepID=UPI000C1EE7A1|nr:type 4 pilus major pilin [Limnohabitans sp. JirII-31]PIT78478.1 hypothetical protein B9Z41_08740 [Limnohabitans sp. JirII-31]
MSLREVWPFTLYREKFIMSKSRQRGFTLIELGIVLTIVAILTLFAVPKVRGFIITGKVQSTGDDLTTAVARIRGNAAGIAAVPAYTSMTTAVLAKALVNRTNAFTVDATVTTIYHKIGSSTAAVTTAPATITASNDAFTVTFSNVNISACPDLATNLQSAAEVITVGGTTVKANASATLDAQTAATKCSDGDNNTFVFTFR